MSRIVRISLLTCIFALCLALAATAVACSSGKGHQIIGNQPCIACHSDDRGNIPAPVTASGIQCGGVVTVVSGADEVVVCQAMFTDYKDGYVIPKEITRVAMVDGQAQISLDNGLWCLCIDGGDSAEITLVEYNASGEDTTIEL